jgi:flavin reductase (DIM6/NTAB) family NADH-FMN oxidoreductase RutF
VSDRDDALESPVLKRLPNRRPTRLTEQSELRTVMSRFATGITVLTAPGEHGHGMTANAFSSVSLDPPLVLCCVSRAARMHSAIAETSAFGVSILCGDQQDLARYFADWRRPGGAAQFDAVNWTPGPRTGAPLLDGALAWLECTLTHAYAGGDHSIFVGEVVSCACSTATESLLFYSGGYHRLGEQARASA